MIVPSLGNFPAPNLAEAYLGGQRLALESTRTAQAAAQHSDEMALQQQRLAEESAGHDETLAFEREKLQQDAIQSQMQMAAMQQERERQNLMEQQKIEIQKAYQQSMLGLREQQLNVSAATAAMRAQQAADKYTAQQRAQQMIEAGVDPLKAWVTAGPEAGAPGGAYTAYARSSQGPFNFGEAYQIPGLPENYKGVRTGPESQRVLQLPPSASTAATPVPGMPGYLGYGSRIFPERETLESKNAKSELKQWDVVHKADLPFITGGLIPSTVRSNRIYKLTGERNALVNKIPKGAATTKGRFKIIEELNDEEE